MEQQSFLIGFAQLALVLTGFVSIFVVFQIDEAAKSRVNTHHATSILLGSLVAFFGALIPIAMYNFGLVGDGLWRWSSAALFVLSFSYFLIMFNMTLRLTKAEFKEAGYLHMTLSYSFGWAGGGALIWNVLSAAHPGYYVLACILTLVAALVGFVAFSVQKILHW
ncbi:MAG: hypothetical protein AAFR82_02875 [Pseudomonadota bacterium]